VLWLYYKVNLAKYHWADALEREKANNASLRDQLEEANHGVGDNIRPTGREMIPRPAGTAGTNFSIQVEMGLSGSTRKYDKYKAIQVCTDGVAWKLSLTITIAVAKPSRPYNECTYRLDCAMGSGSSEG
jgi:hypothetical protein